MKKVTKTLQNMNLSGDGGWLAGGMAGLCALIMFLLPFHAFLTVWGASIFGHYTLLRLWKEGLLLVLVAGSLMIILRERRGWLADWNWGRSREFLRKNVLIVTVLAYLLLVAAAACLALSAGTVTPKAAAAACLALSAGTVTPKAAAYGLLLDSRFLIFFLVVWLAARHSGLFARHWHYILLVPAALVVGFGLLQFTVLPANFLVHFGYGPQTIEAVQTVDQKASYQRIQSTLRGANPLGAYLVLIIATCGALVLRRRSDHRWRPALLLATACLALAATFSRSAWLGALAAIGWLLFWSIHSGRYRQLLLIAASAGLVAFAAVGYSLRQNDVFQNTILHTDEHSRSAASSNQGHLAAARHGALDIVHRPLGGGTGTAGPASVYNDGRTRIAENYFLQIGQEVGVIGLLLFVAINLLLARALWQCRTLLLPQALLASLIGITLINLLSHAWTDDTLSYIWWGLAGSAMALPLTPSGQPSGRQAQANPKKRPS